MRCAACNDGVWRQQKHCPKHKQTDKHRKALERLEDAKAASASAHIFGANANVKATSASDPNPMIPIQSNGIMGALGTALRFMEHRTIDLDYSPSIENHEVGLENPEDNFDGFNLEPSVYDSVVSRASDTLEAWLAAGPSVNTYSDDEGAKIINSDDEEDLYQLGI